MAGDPNANLVDPEGTLQVEEIAYELAAAGILDMGLHFLPRCKPWVQDRCTWSMRRYGLEVWSRTDYILGKDCRIFQDVAIRDPQHHLHHYMILCCLKGGGGEK